MELIALPYSDRIDSLVATNESASQKQIIAALTQAGTANKEAAQLRKDAEGLKKQAADERLAQAKIEDRLSYRRILSENATELKDAILKYPPPHTAEIVIYGAAYDTQLVAAGIESALLQAGWNGRTLNPIAATGIHLGVMLTLVRGADAPTNKIAGNFRQA